MGVGGRRPRTANAASPTAGAATARGRESSSAQGGGGTPPPLPPRWQAPPAYPATHIAGPGCPSLHPRSRIHSPTPNPPSPDQSSFRAPAVRRTAAPARRATGPVAAEPKKDGLNFSSNQRAVREGVGWTLAGRGWGGGPGRGTPPREKGASNSGERDKAGADPPRSTSTPLCLLPFSSLGPRLHRRRLGRPVQHFRGGTQDLRRRVGQGPQGGVGVARLRRDGGRHRGGRHRGGRQPDCPGVACVALFFFLFFLREGQRTRTPFSLARPRTHTHTIHISLIHSQRKRGARSRPCPCTWPSSAVRPAAGRPRPRWWTE